MPVAWLESSEPSYILYTSGTTGQPKGVQRDTGGYAVALAASMKHIYCRQARARRCSPRPTSAGSSGTRYIVYGPLIHGMTTILYEGAADTPRRGHLVEDRRRSTRSTVMFSSPTATRVLKKQDPAFLKKYDLSSLRHLFLAGEPLDEPTHRWFAEALGKPVIDHYWQTETGWPILSSVPGVEETPIKFGSPSFPVYGYDLRLLREADGRGAGAERERRGRRSCRRCRRAA